LTELDLTPREPAGAPAMPRRRRSSRNLIVVGAIAAVLGFVLYQALTSARVYFYNVDEAVERQAELGDQHFRMQGSVVAEDGTGPAGAMLFTLAFADATADVHHVGDEPSGLFELGQNVVVEGNWEGDVFVSRQILVKHSEAYVEGNPDRFDEADVPPAGTGG
jgi:cytochrome c-type biogenesis protein CcmE